MASSSGSAQAPSSANNSHNHNQSRIPDLDTAFVSTSSTRDRALGVSKFKEYARQYKDMHCDYKNLGLQLEPKERKDMLREIIELYVNFKVADIAIVDYFKTQMAWESFDEDEAEWKRYDALQGIKRKRRVRFEEDDYRQNLRQRDRSRVYGDQDVMRERSRDRSSNIMTGDRSGNSNNRDTEAEHKEQVKRWIYSLLLSLILSVTIQVVWLHTHSQFRLLTVGSVARWLPLPTDSDVAKVYSTFYILQLRLRRTCALK